MKLRGRPPAERVEPTWPAVHASSLPAIAAFGRRIEPYSQLQPQRICSPEPKPGVVAFRRLVLTAFPTTSCFGISRSGSAPGRSEHKEGRAWDWKVDARRERDLIDGLLTWLLATDDYGNQHAAARRLGIMYIIWDRRIWGSYAVSEGWRPYRGTNPHTDHVHFSFSWDGALGLTSWWAQVLPVHEETL